ncbi:MAG TPA: helix-turn-helix domain-containing protein, partial [Halobacteriales archaeon]|nr:helix-turn-helix domain-containing protein [Halobacteriales archaeon]
MELPTPQSLKNRRIELGLTQNELGMRAGVSQPLIARIEGGDVDPRLSTLRRIVNAMDEKSGSLVRAEVLMHQDVISVSPADTVQATVKRMQDTGYSQLPVIQD